MKWLPCLISVVLVAACADAQPDTPLAPDGERYAQMETAPVVNSLLDPGDGVCDDVECTLREALAHAAPGAVITFTVTGKIILSEQLDVAKDLTIEGPGAGDLEVSGNEMVRVFDVAAGSAVRISGLSITNGVALIGAGIRNYSADLVLSEVVVAHNRVQSTSATALGGGIANYGTLTLEYSHVTENFASNNSSWGAAHAGGIYSSGTLTVEHSAITRNGVSARVAMGPGISCSGPTTISNSTVSMNGTSQSQSRGGGILRLGNGPLFLVNTTVVENRADWGGGIFLGGPNPATLINSFVGMNWAMSDPDVADPDGRVVAMHNLIGRVEGHNVTNGVEGNIVGVLIEDLGIGPLASNGGPTPTRALVPGSQALDAGTPAGCPAFDQRGVLRPQGSGCDIGAFEARAFAFTGFQAPISEPPLLNEVKAGQAVPVKFSLGGDRGLGILAEGYPVSTQFDCDLSAGTSAVEGTATAGASGLSYDALSDSYTYVWKTDRRWSSSCRRLTLLFADEAGTTRTVEFRFVK